ncbi:hypothetical protein IGI82_001450 [Enterococcus sp. AZ067]|uniref:7-cyano-7-deazaguanine synthase n=1 Tax=Enterococcus TaxID=1350 RepID=UPI002DB6B9DE|nr:7-cyano-7-deazaguanine synthase [Enterococcus innesii]MEB5950482.1 7-cyano-7-deazaguanine synthase [Enterococcus innesii]
MKKVLWTGGWDSTFRVLDLVINKKEMVQPYYVVDRNRASNKIELKTMKEIKNKINSSFPNSKGLIMETIYIEKNEIPTNQIITDKFNRLLNESYMGTQYDWLGRYAEANNLEDLELNIHKDDKAEFFVRPLVEKKDDGNGSYSYVLKDRALGTDYDLFKYYSFPVLDLTKTQMSEIAKKSGFDSLMEMTWFCFNPTWRKTPCGYCNPCKYTRNEGLGRRVPSEGIAKYNKLENKIYYKMKQIMGRN